MDTLTITKPQLEAALLRWTQDARDGKTLSHAETDAMPVEQVAAESVEPLWAELAAVDESTSTTVIAYPCTHGYEDDKAIAVQVSAEGMRVWLPDVLPDHGPLLLLPGQTLEIVGAIRAVRRHTP